MNFTDYLFLPAVLVALGIYFLMPIKKRWIVLLIISVAFYISWSASLLPFILFSSFVAYITAIIMGSKYTNAERKNGKQEDAGPMHDKKKIKRRNKSILLIGVGLIILLLLYIKAQIYLLTLPFFSGLVECIGNLYQKFTDWYVNTPIGSFFMVSEVAQEFEMGSLIYPLGISYYTLSLMGYLADVYWKKENPEKNYFKLLLFAIYFPKILEGPISKHRDIKFQLVEGHAFDYKRVCFGLQRAIWGYFKKLVIADRLAVFVNTVFLNTQYYMGSEFLIAAILGAVQLYCDFSGCMDIALGVSECFGITLEENFKQPFASRSAAEFWRRWHITLGAWFKDYVFMPLAVSPRLMKVSGFLRKKIGKRVGKIFTTVIPLVAVWLLTGLWHGTGINYIVWGLYWGVLIILSTVFEPEIRKLTVKLKLDTSSNGFRVFQKSRTFLLFVIGRIISIPDSLETTWNIIRTIFTEFAPWKLVDGSLLNLGISGSQYVVVALALALVGYVGNRHEKGVKIREWIATRPLLIRWLIYYGAIFAVLILGAYGPGYNASDFVYMQF